MHGIGGVCEGIATGLFASVKANPNVITKNALGGGIFISGSLELLKEQILTIMICMIFSSHKLYYF